jgi:hypothetical protein
MENNENKENTSVDPETLKVDNFFINRNKEKRLKMRRTRRN